MRIYATVDSVLFTGYNWKELQLWNQQTAGLSGCGRLQTAL